MKIEIKAIEGVEEVPEDMKNAAIARKKAFAKPKKKFSKNKLYALTYDEQTNTLTGKEATIPKGMERIKCPKCFGRPMFDKNCLQDGCNGTGWIIRRKKTASKAKKVVAKVTKPVTKTAKVITAVKKVISKKKKHEKKNRSKNL